jgi:hypothetical protein
VVIVARRRCVAVDDIDLREVCVRAVGSAGADRGV